MADKVIVSREKLVAVADAIRAQNETADALTLDEMPVAIGKIQGSGGEDLERLLSDQETLISELKTALYEKSAGGIFQYVKIAATPDSKSQMKITNPLGGFAKKVSIACPSDSETMTKRGVIQQYTMDASIGLGGMKLINSSTGNITLYGSRQVEKISANSQFEISEGVIIVRPYNATTATWDEACAYEVEIWQ